MITITIITNSTFFSCKYLPEVMRKTHVFFWYQNLRWFEKKSKDLTGSFKVCSLHFHSISISVANHLNKNPCKKTDNKWQQLFSLKNFEWEFHLFSRMTYLYYANMSFWKIRSEILTLINFCVITSCHCTLYIHFEYFLMDTNMITMFPSAPSSGDDLTKLQKCMLSTISLNLKKMWMILPNHPHYRTILNT